MQDFQKRYSELVRSDDPNNEPMEKTMNRFNSLYMRPVIPFYRSVLYDLVQVSSIVSVAGWNYRRRRKKIRRKAGGC